MQAVDLRLAEAAAERAPHEPLQLDAARRAHRQEVGEPRVRLVGAHPRALELRRLQQALRAQRERRSERRAPVARTTFGEPRDVAGDIALGIAQADEHEQRRTSRAERDQPRRMLPCVASPRPRMQARSAGSRSRRPRARARIARCRRRGRPDAQDLHVGLDRLERTEQREHARALALVAQPLIGGDLDRERRPRIRRVLGEHAVAVREADRHPHLSARTGVSPARARRPRLAPEAARPASSARIDVTAGHARRAGRWPPCARARRHEQRARSGVAQATGAALRAIREHQDRGWTPGRQGPACARTTCAAVEARASPAARWSRSSARSARVKRPALEANDRQQGGEPRGQRDVARVPGRRSAATPISGRRAAISAPQSSTRKYTMPRTGTPPGFRRMRSIR